MRGLQLEREGLEASHQRVQIPDVGVGKTELDLSQWCSGQQTESNSKREDSMKI